jgi:tetratricopeptide (TPR) repeat protein
MIGLAATHIISVTNFEVLERELALDSAEALLRRVMEQRPDNGHAHYFQGMLLRLRGELPAALEAYSRAIELNPSLANAYADAGFALIRLGQPREGLEQIRYAMRLSPKDYLVGTWNAYAGVAELALGNDDAALEWLRRAAALSPRAPFVRMAAASALALTGDRDGARKHVEEVKRLAPRFDEPALLRFFLGAGSKPGRKSRFIDGLRLALNAS